MFNLSQNHKILLALECCTRAPALSDSLTVVSNSLQCRFTTAWYCTTSFSVYLLLQLHCTIHFNSLQYYTVLQSIPKDPYRDVIFFLHSDFGDAYLFQMTQQYQSKFLRNSLCAKYLVDLSDRTEPLKFYIRRRFSKITNILNSLVS